SRRSGRLRARGRSLGPARHAATADRAARPRGAGADPRRQRPHHLLRHGWRMTLWIVFAALAGVLVGVSRQVNGRLSLSTSPLMASFWNHIIGFIILTVTGLVAGEVFGGLIPPGAADAPLLDYVGGIIGVIFVAVGSWLIPRIGATNTALLLIG